MTRIDLHTHSNVSDGTQAPAELLQDAAESGLDVVALTDHDSSQGWGEARAAAQRLGIGLIPGVEFSSQDAGFSVHVLGYLVDDANADLVAMMREVRSARDARAQQIVRAIGEDYDLSWNDVLAHVHDGATVGRPHIADALVEKGLAVDRGAAFRTILSPRGPYYSAHFAPAPLEVVRAIVAAGGVAVIAHPAGVTRYGHLTDEKIGLLADAGLAGLEVEHRDNDPAGRAHLRELARDLGLFTTGSSDYHGAGKPNRLGEHVTQQAVLDEIVARARGTAPTL